MAKASFLGNRIVKGIRALSGAMAAAVLLAGLACGPGSAPPEPQKPAEPAAPVMKWAVGNAGQLRVDDGGAGGTPVIFVHGLGADRHVWKDQLEHLRKTRRAVAFDLRGHGESEPSGDGTYTIDAFADDVAAVATSLKIDSYILVGHSMGGLVIADCAGKHPEKVAGLLFADSAGDKPNMPPKELKKWLDNFQPEKYDKFRDQWFGEMLAKAQPGVRDQVMAMIQKTPQPVVAACVNSMSEYSPVAVLEAFVGPTLAIITPENSGPQSLQKVVPGLKTKTIEGASHWVMMDKPDEFNAAMDEFLTGM